MSHAAGTPIGAADLAAQRWKFWAALALWPLFLVTLPVAWERHPLLGLGYTLFPGVYLFTWLGYLMHESWHRYVPGLPHALLFRLYAWMLLTDPQVYRIAHASHHRDVNSYGDLELYPFGRIEPAWRRRVYHLLQVLMGGAFSMPMVGVGLARHPVYRRHYRPREALVSALVWGVLLALVATTGAALSGAGLWPVLGMLALVYWLGGLVAHHSQLVQHGNLIVEGDLDHRNVASRNLASDGFGARLFLFLTHQDAREHVVHHTRTGLYNRPFPGRVPLPDGAVRIQLRDYARILLDMLAGRPSAA